MGSVKRIPITHGGSSHEGCYVRLDRAGKRRLLKGLRKIRDAALIIRDRVVLSRADGHSVGDTAAILGVCTNTIRRIVKRFLEHGFLEHGFLEHGFLEHGFLEHGEAGLIDRREENGSAKLDEAFLRTLHIVVADSPLSCSWKRPTWTHEMLVTTLEKLTGIKSTSARTIE